MVLNQPHYSAVDCDDDVDAVEEVLEASGLAGMRNLAVWIDFWNGSMSLSFPTKLCRFLPTQLGTQLDYYWNLSLPAPHSGMYAQLLHVKSLSCQEFPRLHY